MRHNSVVSGHPKSTRIPQVDGSSTELSNFGRHTSFHEAKRVCTKKTQIMVTIPSLYDSDEPRFNIGGKVK